MKGFMKKGMVMAVACCVFLNGCGTGMAKMTKEEEKLIVAYASGAVAKANKYQTQGLTYPHQETEEEDGDTGIEETKPGNQVSGQDTQQEGTDMPAENQVTLTEALNIASVTAEYHGYQITRNYMEGDYFALNANNGYTYLILNIGLSNISDRSIECDLLARNMKSSLLVNGSAAADGMATILFHDFMSYMGTLDASSSEETLMIFEVPEDSTADIQSLALDLEVDGTMYHIELE